MEVLLTPIVEFYRSLLQPVAPFTWFGLPLSTLDVAAALRLCIVMRQIREVNARQHVEQTFKAKRAIKGKDKAREAGLQDGLDDTVVPAAVETRSFVRDAAATLVVVYGGEVMSGSSCSILSVDYLSLIYALSTAPRHPAILHALGCRTRLLHAHSSPRRAPPLRPGYDPPDRTAHLPLRRALPCLSPLQPHSSGRHNPLFPRRLHLSLDPPPHIFGTASLLPNPSRQPTNAYTQITANGGFLVVNALSFLSPTSLTLRTPPELQPYGWATADLWAAPGITALFALLTHAQPFWADLHLALASFLAPGSVAPVFAADGVTVVGRAVQAVDAETARAACALVLAALFSGRAARNFGGMGWVQKPVDASSAWIGVLLRVLGLSALTIWVAFRYGR